MPITEPGIDTTAGTIADGGPGDDTIFAPPNSQTLRGGSGNDTITANDHNADTIDCGPGDDIVTADAADTIVRCEHVTLVP